VTTNALRLDSIRLLHIGWSNFKFNVKFNTMINLDLTACISWLWDQSFPDFRESRIVASLQLSRFSFELLKERNRLVQQNPKARADRPRTEITFNVPSTQGEPAIDSEPGMRA